MRSLVLKMRTNSNGTAWSTSVMSYIQILAFLRSLSRPSSRSIFLADVRGGQVGRKCQKFSGIENNQR